MTIEDQRGSETICPVHNTELLEGVINLSFGLPMPDEHEEERSRLFPFAHTRRNGGCLVGGDVDQALVRFCSECRVEEQKWLRERKKLRKRR